MPPSAIIVGAGIGGLATAIALRQANFTVLVLERQDAIQEIGQAVGIPPNATRVLQSFGMDIPKARPCSWKGVDLVRADISPMEHIGNQINPVVESVPSYFIHRQDYLDALRDRATSSDGPGTAVKIRLSCTATSYSPDAGSVTLESGEILTADLIIAADGVRSKAHQYVIGEERPAHSTGLVLLRFTIPTETLRSDPRTAAFLQMSENDMATYFRCGRANVMRYPCRSGLLQNISVYTTPENLPTTKSRKEVAFDLLRGSDIAAIPELVEDDRIYTWTVRDRDPFEKLYRGKMLLLGDACHPMRPSLGQGASAAVEDAGVLGIVMRDLNHVEDLGKRLEIWQHLRKQRVGSAQLFSRVSLGAEMWQNKEDLRKAQDYVGAENVPSTLQDMISHFMHSDLLKEAGDYMLIRLQSNEQA